MIQLALMPPLRRPILRYHGGKWRIANWIIEHFPPHGVYVEPFAGAASVLLRKPRSRVEVINDLDSEVVNVFRVMRDPGSADRLRDLLHLTPFSREEFAASYEPTDDLVEMARRTIIRSFQGFSSASVTRPSTGWAHDSSPRKVSARVWAGYPDFVPQFVNRLRGVSIEHRNAIDVITCHDSPTTLFYIDPPYPMATRHSWQQCYRFEMSEADHRFLANVLHRIRGMAVVSGYGCTLYDAELYRDWKRVSKAAHAASNRGSVNRTEVLWISPRAAEALGGA